MMNQFTQRFSPQQTLAIRKELLLTRAAMERTALIQASAELCANFGHFKQIRWFKWLISGQTLQRKLSELLQPYPLLSSIAPLLFSAPALLRQAGKARPLMKWGILAVAGWLGLRLWQRPKK